jgi:M6 family metalloprotease-like protein
MKNASAIIMIILCEYFFGILSIQIYCKSFDSIRSDSLNVKGGKYITASGELKILVVFAKFKDDTSSHPYWPADSYPAEMTNFIDPDMQKGSTHFLNLTNYYNQMSSGKFRVIGKTIGAVTPYSMGHYISTNQKYPNISQANRDILESIDDSVDFNEYDNWNYIDDYNFINSPDGIVDMIIVIWRGLVFSDEWSGNSSLGDGQEFWVENHKKRVRMHNGGTPTNGINGSGVTVQYWDQRAPERNLKVVIHEMAHWLIGPIHPYNNFSHTFWGMLTLASEGICANAFERELLGWINTKLIEDTTLTVEIGDFITAATAYKYHLKNGLPDEHYYFENHQKLSIYDNATSNQNDKGIFILHFSVNIYNGDCIRVLTSDGFWDWDSPKHSDCWGNDLPVFRKKSVNRNASGNRDNIIIDNTNCGFIYSYINDQGETECNDWLHGYGFKNSFDTTFNDVFSPWSNPPAKTYNLQLTDFSMEILNQIGSSISVKFTTNNAVGCKPSKPPLGSDPIKLDDQDKMGISLVWGADNWDKLMIEPDINWSQLQIKIVSTDWKTIYSGTDRFWSDSNYDYNEVGGIAVSFRTRVRDNQNKWSMWSDVYETVKIINNTITAENKNLNKLSEFQLYQNYPNPFNSISVIKYSLPKSSQVTVKIFSTLGDEIETLVNEEKPVGTYELNWSAANLPSGVYFYRLQAGDFVQTRKMILLK